MPLTDNALELVFSFLLESASNVEDFRPVSRLLATRRTRGFEHVKIVLLRQGMRWAMEENDIWKNRAYVAEEQLRMFTLVCRERVISATIETESAIETF